MKLSYFSAGVAAIEHSYLRAGGATIEHSCFRAGGASITLFLVLLAEFS